jgi:hypothetical protein
VAPLAVRFAAFWRAFWGALSAWFGALRSQSVPAVRAQLAAWSGRASAVREERWPEAKSQLAVQIARVRLLVSRQRDRLAAFQRARRDKKRRSTAPAPRVQRTSAAAGRAERGVAVARPRNHRWLAVTLAALGVGLGVYALAPRSGADRIRINRTLALGSTEAPRVESTPSPAGTPVLPPVAPAVAGQPLAAPNDVASTSEASSTDPASLRFGEAEVQHGRMFSLRMSGPVESIEERRARTASRCACLAASRSTARAPSPPPIGRCSAR